MTNDQEIEQLARVYSQRDLRKYLVASEVNPIQMPEYMESLKWGDCSVYFRTQHKKEVYVRDDILFVGNLKMNGSNGFDFIVVQSDKTVFAHFSDQGARGKHFYRFTSMENVEMVVTREWVRLKHNSVRLKHNSENMFNTAGLFVASVGLFSAMYCLLKK
jgi:hypothetical protein